MGEALAENAQEGSLLARLLPQPESPEPTEQPVQRSIAPAAAPAPAANANQDLRLLLARTLQMEAGNQGFEGMVDVGSVIRNREVSGNYGDGIAGVILRPGQFSAWNGVTGYAGGEQGQPTDFTPNAQAFAAADAVLSGEYEDRTGGATHYYAILENSPAPSWTNDSFRRIGGGDHYFGDADGVGSVIGNTGAVNSSYRGPTGSDTAQSPTGTPVDPVAQMQGENVQLAPQTEQQVDQPAAQQRRSIVPSSSGARVGQVSAPATVNVAGQQQSASQIDPNAAITPTTKPVDTVKNQYQWLQTHFKSGAAA